MASAVIHQLHSVHLSPTHTRRGEIANQTVYFQSIWSTISSDDLVYHIDVEGDTMMDDGYHRRQFHREM